MTGIRQCLLQTCWLGIWISIICASVSPSHAEDLTLDGILQKAVLASPDLQIAHQDVEISKTDIAIARADYFPTIKSQFNTEYMRDLEKQVMPVVAVGNTLIPSGTRFQNSLGLSLNHTLIDFGIRKRKVEGAQADVNSKAAIYDQSLRDLKLKLVDLYASALLDYKSMQMHQAILALAKQGYQMKKRLNTAGTLSKVDVATEAIQVAQSMDDIETFKRQLADDLVEIGFYTHQHYDVEDITIAPVEPEKAVPTLSLDLSHSPEARNYNAQMDEKEKEIEILKRQYLPQVSLYSYYSFYGFDPDHLSKAVAALSQRSVSMGLSVSMPVFDGFKNLNSIRKAKLEKEKLALQKTKAILDLKHQADQLQAKLDTHLVLLGTKAAIVNSTQDKLVMEKRLSDQQLIDKTVAIQDHINRIQHQYESEKVLIQGIIAMKKLKILEMTL